MVLGGGAWWPLTTASGMSATMGGSRVLSLTVVKSGVIYGLGGL